MSLSLAADFVVSSPTIVLDAGVLGVAWSPPQVASTSDYAVAATLGASLTLVPPASPPQVCCLTLALRQDATGGRTLTLGGGIRSAGGAGVVLSAAPNALDVLLLFTIDGGASWTCLVCALDVR